MAENMCTIIFYCLPVCANEDGNVLLQRAQRAV
jgi:hypothetical protein